MKAVALLISVVLCLFMANIDEEDLILLKESQEYEENCEDKGCCDDYVEISQNLYNSSLEEGDDMDLILLEASQ